MTDPILVGGNGHSGTRIFAEILAASGVNMGIPGLTCSRSSYDLNMRNLLHAWVEPYLRGEVQAKSLEKMERAFLRRLWLYFPRRRAAWGFKNPRSMLILPFYHKLFPNLRFIHVVRDGRDVALGNVLAGNEAYIDAYLDAEHRGVSAEERMIRFWGLSNQRAARYGLAHLEANYLRIRFEDLCDRPEELTAQILRFAGRDTSSTAEIARLVRKPSSIGRWRTYDGSVVARVQSAGAPWLQEFRYR